MTPKKKFKAWNTGTLIHQEIQNPTFCKKLLNSVSNQLCAYNGLCGNWMVCELYVVHRNIKTLYSHVSCLKIQ